MTAPRLTRRERSLLDSAQPFMINDYNAEIDSALKGCEGFIYTTEGQTNDDVFVNDDGDEGDDESNVNELDKGMIEPSAETTFT